MNDLPRWPSGFTARDSSGTDPLTTCHPARIHALLRGSDHATAAEHALVQRLLHHDPALRDRSRTAWSCQARTSLYFARLKVGAIVDLATGIPDTALAPHRIPPDLTGPPTPVVYVNADPTVHEHAALLTRHDNATTAVSADIRDPHTAWSTIRDTGLIPTGTPVAFLAVGLADHFTDPADLGRTLTGLAGVAPAGSLLAITHRSDTTHLARAGDDPTPDCRADLARLVHDSGWNLQEAATLALLWHPAPHDVRYGTPSVAFCLAELAAPGNDTAPPSAGLRDSPTRLRTASRPVADDRHEPRPRSLGEAGGSA
ncbi:SAM-dependent methyltransferase [Saccharothrix sp. Mg75]|uniref:SAM-dependent methyltransferase n=1 Tax=Saccharothrix sp. Mg75 TaxID=3445357 RepID=UPI003EEA5B7C